MKRIALLAALALSALAAGDLRADDGCPCPAGVCALQGCADCGACASCPRRLPADCGSRAAPGADVCSSSRFPRLHAIAAHVRHPFGGRFAVRGR